MRDNLGIVVARIERVRALYWFVVAAADWPDLRTALELAGGDFVAVSLDRAEDRQPVVSCVANREPAGFSRFVGAPVLVTGLHAAKLVMDCLSSGRAADPQLTISEGWAAKVHQTI